jgi:hypothetical protein
MASKVGEPTLQDPKQTSAPQVAQHSADVLTGKTDSHSVSVETIGKAAPPPNQAAPRSDSVTSDANGTPEAKSDEQPAPAPPQINQAASSDSSAGASVKKDSNSDPAASSSSKAKKKKGLRKILPF